LYEGSKFTHPDLNEEVICTAADSINGLHQKLQEAAQRADDARGEAVNPTLTPRPHIVKLMLDKNLENISRALNWECDAHKPPVEAGPSAPCDNKVWCTTHYHDLYMQIMAVWKPRAQDLSLGAFDKHLEGFQVQVPQLLLEGGAPVDFAGVPLPIPPAELSKKDLIALIDAMPDGKKNRSAKKITVSMDKALIVGFLNECRHEAEAAAEAAAEADGAGVAAGDEPVAVDGAQCTGGTLCCITSNRCGLMDLH
jgi:hypothetical protein